MSKKTHHKEQNQTQDLSKNNLVLGISVIVFIAIFVLLLNIKPSSEAKAQNSPWRGNENATVVVQEFSDFACPACALSSSLIDLQLYPQYKDKVKFIHRDFPIHGNDAPSFTAAIAARCAQKQNKFWEMSSKLFSSQQDWSTIEDDQKLLNKFITYGSEIGLETSSLQSCIVSKETKKLVEQDQREGQSKNIGSTPTFFVNDVRIVGARELEDTIKKALGINVQTTP